jgi:hypothetical protein
MQRSATNNAVTGLRDRLAAEGIAANRLLSEVLSHYCEVDDHRPFTSA